MSLPYTICFCRKDDRILMLYRLRSPNEGRWNGLGGKLEEAKAPLAGVIREIYEEAGLDLHAANEVRFAGLVTWEIDSGADPTRPSRGMYAFVAELSPDQAIWPDERHIPEGRLCWQPVEWVCDPQNPAVVANIPYFLPRMLSQSGPVEYYCEYQAGKFSQVIVRPLPEDILETMK